MVTSILCLIAGYFLIDRTIISYNPYQDTFLPAQDFASVSRYEIIRRYSSCPISYGATSDGRLAIAFNPKLSIYISLAFVIEYSDSNNHRALEICDKFYFENNKNKAQDITWIGETRSTSMRLRVFSGTSHYTQSFKVELSFKRDINVHRAAMVVNGLPTPIEIFTKNEQFVLSGFEKEYWLGHGGVVYRSDSMKVIIKKNGDISSLQLAIDKPNGKSQLWINLDYEKDHPRIYLPRDKGGQFIDRSASVMKKAQTTEYHFLIQFTDFEAPTTWLLSTPSDYKATLIFSEHADNSDLRTQRAVFFGADTIAKASNAVGGFVKYRIPVTKSIFYSNKEAISNHDFNTDFQGPQLSLLNNYSYANFLDELHSTGDYEICLHSADPLTDDRRTLEEALQFVCRRYESKTWIDHGMSDSYSNRESYICDGIDSLSEYFSADLWRKYGIKYFWDYSVEKLRGSASLKSKLKNFQILSFLRCQTDRYLGDIDVLQPSFGAHIPTPIYWKLKTRTDEFFSWSTLRHAGHNSAMVWDYILRQDALNTLIQNRGVAIIHFYPAFVGDIMGYSNGIWKNDGRTIMVNQKFDKVLQRLAQNRDSGKINLTTVGCYLDYQLLLEKVEIESYKNHILIRNRNQEKIAGLSLFVKTERELSRLVKFRTIRDNGRMSRIILDIGPMETIRIDCK